ncbi:hypothetical protein SSX86_000727 [Deinandra increscens subsp. villosa]|uniref:Cytochrome P450 n=1 Tax=Deinandra increscens subsp. villosa TaxID=3103831 RepID=A0AAP0DU39_9ASTR
MIQLTNNELTLAVVTVSTVILAMFWYKRTLSSSSNGAPPLPPGPRSLPVVGFLPFLGQDLHKQFTNMAHTYGPIFKLKLGSRLYVVINTPELAKAVVRDHDDTFANRALIIAGSVISYGGQDIIFSKNNTYWRNLRKLFVHEVLSNKNLEASSCFRRDEVRTMIKNVFRQIGTKINITEMVFLTEANVLTSMIWGNTRKTDGHVEVKLREMVLDLSEIFNRPNLSDFFPILARFDLQGIKRDMKKQLQKFDRIMDGVIEDRIKSNSEMSLGDDEGKKDFLQILLDLKNKEDATPLNFTQIKALVMDILTAGTDTTSTLTEWAGAEIIRNHKVMKRVQDELTEIVGLNNMVEESHLSKLKYLDAVIKETHRLHIVVPFMIPRSPSKACIVGGYTVPEGCTVLVNGWAIHRDPRYWDNPLEFNPNRFLTSLDAKELDYRGNSMHFLPFGSGRRVCAGLPLAEKMQMFILASLFHSFDWSLPKGDEHDLSERFGLTIRKRNPLVAVPSQRLTDASLYM